MAGGNLRQEHHDAQLAHRPENRPAARELTDGPADAEVAGDFTTAGGAAATRELLARRPDVDAVFVANDLMARGALAVLAEHGLERMATADLVCVLGWERTDVEPPEPLLQSLRDIVARGGRVMSHCSGAYVVAASGLLDLTAVGPSSP